MSPTPGPFSPGVALALADKNWITKAFGSPGSV